MVGFLHFEPNSLGVVLLPLAGDPAKHRGDKTGHGGGLFAVQPDVKQVLNLLDRRIPRNEVGTVGVPGQRRILRDLVFVMDLACNLLQDVLDGHQPGHSSVLIDHNGHVGGLPLQFRQQLGNPFGFGNELDWPHQALQAVVGHRTVPDVDQVLQIDKSLDVFDMVPVNRNPGMLGGSDQLLEHLGRGLDVDGHHMGTRNHDVSRRGLPEFHHRLNEILLSLLQDSLFLSHVDKGLNFLFNMLLRFFLLGLGSIESPKQPQAGRQRIGKDFQDRAQQPVAG